MLTEGLTKFSEVLYMSVLNFAAAFMSFAENTVRAVRGFFDRLTAGKKTDRKRLLLPSGSGRLIGNGERRDFYSMPVRVKREHIQ